MSSSSSSSSSSCEQEVRDRCMEELRMMFGNTYTDTTLLTHLTRSKFDVERSFEFSLFSFLFFDFIFFRFSLIDFYFLMLKVGYEEHATLY
jgi:hypothetical protein